MRSSNSAKVEGSSGAEPEMKSRMVCSGLRA